MNANPKSAAESRGQATDWVLLGVPALIWGASYFFIAEGLSAIGPNGLTFTRILIGFATLALFPSSRKAIPRSDWAAIALLGFVWFAFPLSMFPHAEMRVSSALTGMLTGATPLFTVIVASMLSRRLPSRGMVIGLLVGLTGVVVIALPTLGEGASSAIGLLLIVAAVISYGFALPVAHPLQKRHGALPVIWRAQAVALVLTAPMGVPDLLAARWTPRPLLSILVLGALGTGIAFVVMTTAAGKLGPSRASAAVFLSPGVALLLGVMVRGERVALLSVAGCVICIAGAWLMRRSQSEAAAAKDPTAEPAARRVPLTIEWRDSVEGVDWDELSRLYRDAPLGNKRPSELAIVFANSMFKYFVYDAGRLVGAGRALADGIDCSYICDVAVHPSHQGLGIGREIVTLLVRRSREHRKIILYAAPGKERFYQKLGFRRMATAMAIFQNQDRAEEQGLLLRENPANLKRSA